jgi:hypothetical protein
VESLAFCRDVEEYFSNESLSKGGIEGSGEVAGETPDTVAPQVSLVALEEDTMYNLILSNHD